MNGPNPGGHFPSAPPAQYDFEHIARVTRACRNCRASKTKCVTSESQEQPCMRCRFSRLECVYEPTQKQRQRRARSAQASPAPPKLKARRGRRRLAVKPPPLMPYPPSPVSISEVTLDNEEMYCKCPSESGSSGPRTPYLPTTPYLPPTPLSMESTDMAMSVPLIRPPVVPPIAIYGAESYAQWVDNQNQYMPVTPLSATGHTFDARLLLPPTPTVSLPPALPDSPCLPLPFAGGAAAMGPSQPFFGDESDGYTTNELGLYELDLPNMGVSFDLDGLPSLPPLETDEEFYASLDAHVQSSSFYGPGPGYF
ncbi:Zn(2)-C6 fungal-type domain-containing protein [Mycena chlorophos]|uniref:Zn(2)-C6 fungal-type domain-containing protein n=1 Tax=Mycena chlorophos TaxID=658473 RepID=A0A8H6SY34_MYCCL|nr:Zn(2)-C6 fungal-type domain-containing protein [Mycena chlorophos]